MRVLIIVSSIYFLSCNSVNQKNYKGNNNSVLINKESIVKVDSLKWIYYSMNFFGKALFYDTINREEIKLDPVECDVTLDEYRRVTNDSSYYLFSFKKAGYNFLYVNVVGMEGIGIYKNNLYPIIMHVKSEYQNSPDSIKSHLSRADSAFRVYLRTYSGKISPWLKQEAFRRKVLQ
jgi:hypothetical protein